ncbi:MAG: leucine-rich repeat protein [Eubacteriales bacterium]
MKKFMSGLLSVLMVAQIATVPVAVAMEEEDSSLVVAQEKSIPMTELDPDLVIEVEDESTTVPMTPLNPSLVIENASIPMTALDPSLVIENASIPMTPLDPSLVIENASIPMTPIDPDLVIENKPESAESEATAISDSIVTISEDDVDWIQSVKKSDDGTEYVYDATITFDTATGTITDATSNISSVDIPSKITVGDEEYPVTSIGSWAFGQHPELTSIVIPEGVTTLGYVSFHECPKLSKVVLPTTLTLVENKTSGVFMHCPLLKTAGPADDGNDYNYVLPNPKTTNLPDATVLGNSLFGRNQYLESVVIPEGVVTIDNNIFSGCTGLTSVSLPESLRTIGDGAFYECFALEELYIPEGVTFLGSGCFYGCIALEKLYIPSTLKGHIGEQPFGYYSSLSSMGPIGSNAVLIYNMPDTIPERAFTNFWELEEIIIPTNVTTIEDSAFWGCNGITDVYYMGSKLEWEYITIQDDNSDLTEARIHYNYQLVDGASTVKFMLIGGAFPVEPSEEGGGITYSQDDLELETDRHGYFEELPVPVKGGYEFLYWRNSSGEQFTEGSQFTSDQTVYAVWAECEHFEVTFDYGQDNQIETLKTNKDKTLYWLAEEGVRVGHIFENWQTEVNGAWVEVTTDYVFTQDTIVYPNWKAANEVELGLVDMGEIVLKENEYTIFITQNGVQPCDGATVTIGGKSVTVTDSITVLTMPETPGTLGITIEKDKFFSIDEPYFTPEAGKAYFYALESLDKSISFPLVSATLVQEGIKYNFLTDTPTFFASNSTFIKNDSLLFDVTALSAASLDIVNYKVTQGSTTLASYSPSDDAPSDFKLDVQRMDTGGLMVKGLKANQRVYLTATDAQGNSETEELSLQIDSAYVIGGDLSLAYMDGVSAPTEEAVDDKDTQTFLKDLWFKDGQLKIDSDLLPVSFFYDEGDGIYRYILNGDQIEKKVYEDYKNVFKSKTATRTMFGLESGNLEEQILNFDKYTDLRNQLQSPPTEFTVGGISATLDGSGYLQYNTKNVESDGEAALFVMGSVTSSIYRNAVFGGVPVTIKGTGTLGLELRVTAEFDKFGNAGYDNLFNTSFQTAFITYVADKTKALDVSIIPQVYIGILGGIGATVNSNSTMIGGYGDANLYLYCPADPVGLDSVTILADAGIAGAFLGEEIKLSLISTQGEKTLWERSPSKTRAHTLSTTAANDMARVASPDVTAVKEYSLNYTQPKLVTVNNKKYLFWLDDAGEQRTDLNCSTIFYATSNDGVIWSEPEQLFGESENDFAQFNLSVAVENNNIHLVWLQGTEIFLDDIDLAEKAMKTEAYQAVLDTTTMKLSEPTRITTNDKYEGLTTFSEDGSMLLWLENDMSKGIESIFSVEANNTLCYAYTNDLEKPVTVLTDANLGSCVIGHLGLDETIAYLEVDEEVEDNESGSITTLKLYDIKSETRKEMTSGVITGLTFVNNSLYWMIGNQIYSTTDGVTVTELLDEEDGYVLPTDFLILEDDDKTYLVYGGVSEGADEGSPVMTIYASEKTATGWSPAYELFQTDSQTIYNLSGYVENGMFHLAYLERNGEYASVMVTHVEPQRELSLDFMYYDWEAMELGKPLELLLTVSNVGGVPLDNVYVYVNNELEDTFNKLIPIGGSEMLTSYGFTLPASLNGVTEYVVKVVASPDDLATTEGVTMSVGYTDLQMSAVRQKVNSNEFVVLNMENLTNIPTNATLNVYRDSWEGDIVFTKDFSNLSKNSSIMQVLDLSTIELTLDARIDNFYFEVVPTTASELYESDNKASVYLGTNREVLSDDLSFTITYNANGGTVSPSSGTTDSSTGKLTSLPTPTRTGYTFNGWYTSTTGGTKVTTSTEFTENTTIYAQWTKNSTDSGTGTPDSGTGTPDSGSNNNNSSNSGSNSSSNSSTSTSTTTYTNTLPTSDYGTITMTPKNPKSGDTVSLEISPNDGYEVDEVIVTSTSTGAEIEVTLNDDGTYSFTQPSGTVSIEVIYNETEKSNTIIDLPIINNMSTSTFSDIRDASVWYYEPVKFIYDRGLMAGTSDSLFSPELPISRGMIVQILYRLAGSPSATGTNFTDVTSTDYYANAVAWASSVGVSTGTGNNQFSPNKDMSREELVVMLYAYEKIYGNGGFTDMWSFPLDFSDSNNITDWAYEATAWCFMNGIIVGREGNTFDPKGSAKRCEVAQILKNFIELYS